MADDPADLLAAARAGDRAALARLLSLVERGGETSNLTYVVELPSWLIRPDPIKE